MISMYCVAQYKVDLYHLFYEKALDILRLKGVLCYITPIAFLKTFTMIDLGNSWLQDLQFK